MSGTPRQGRFGAVYIDCTTAGTQAVGTSTLTLVAGRTDWTFDQQPDFVDTTSMGDTSKNALPGLPNAVGDLNGNWDSAGLGTLVYNIINAPAERGCMIFPDISNVPTQYITGKAFFGVKSGGGATAAVNFDIHFEAGPSGMNWVHP